MYTLKHSAILPYNKIDSRLIVCHDSVSGWIDPATYCDWEQLFSHFKKLQMLEQLVKKSVCRAVLTVSTQC